MKRILALVLLVLCIPFSVVADNVDLSALSLEELLGLRNSVNAAINEQLGFDFSDSKIGMGYYDTGVDIKSGKYDLICTYAELDKDYDSKCMVAVISSRAEDADTLGEFYYIMPGQQIFLSLEEGNVLVIARGNFLIQSSEHSWAP